MQKTPAIQQGWLRALLYCVFSILLVYAASYVALIFFDQAPVTDNEESTLLSFIFSYLIYTAVLVVLAFLFRKFIDRQSFSSLGFRWSGAYFATGFFLGILLLTAGSIILVLLQMLFFTEIEPDINKLLTGLLLFIIVAFTEEIAFRGYILNNLMQSMNKWYALILSSLPFAIVHIQNPGVAEANYFPILNIFIAGMLLGINYIYTKNLWFGIALHFSWNFLQGPILGYDVSGFSSAALLQQTQKGPVLFTGGGFGFEGSILCLALSGVAIFLLSSYYNKHQQPPVEI